MTRTITTNWVHEGYMDGISGKEPDPELDRSDEYSKGWLAGASDREAGIAPPKFFGPCELPCKRGDEVTIPKGTTVSNIHHGVRKAGRTYKVKLHDVYPGVPAYIDYHHRSNPNEDGVVRPTAPKLVWPGTGGYWSDADVNEVFKD